MDSIRFSFAFLVLFLLQSEAAGNASVFSECPCELQGKITRVEVQMEEWDKHLKKFEEIVLSVLEHRREEMENIVEDQNKKIEKQSEEYGKLQDAQNRKLDEVSHEQMKIKDAITNKTLGKHDTPIVAFSAYINANGHYSEKEILKFPHVLLNEGDGYDATSGYFTAPVPGLYQFTAHVCNDYKQYMVYAIVHNETTVALSAVYESVNVNCASVSAIVKMKARERVCVKSMYSNSYLFSNEHRWPSFIGVLLRITN